MLEHKRIIDVQQSLVDVPLLDGINIPDLQLNKETLETDQLLEPNEEQIPTRQGSLLAEEISVTNDEHLDAVNEQPSPVTKDSSLQESSPPPAIPTPLPALLDSPSPTRATSSPALLDTAPPATLTPVPQDSPASVQASLTTKKSSLAKVSKNSLEDQADPLAGFLKSFSKNIKEQLSGMKTTLSTKINALDVKLTVMQKDVDEIKTFIMESRQMTKNERLVAFQTFCESYDAHHFPMSSMENFDNFDSDLEGQMFDDLQQHLLCTTNTSYDLMKIITSIFKTFLSRDVIMSFTAQIKKQG
ncbi:uncharacterized protein LOC103317040 [Nasonia vitripennis]|uniref:Uncharacterized protein n=1 Tax=Nasonia vitripennis TaxID=7425 RepID=A0A7M7QFB5_NASVI|nr:uncharacterized protein LOC103317040 [Nasonia vitripennis]